MLKAQEVEKGAGQMGKRIPITLHLEHVHNILDIVARVDPGVLQGARGWYRDWNRYLVHRAKVDNVPTDTAIVAFAWLSSNTSLANNLGMFEQYIYNGARNVVGLSRYQRNKLTAIHMSGNPLKYLTSPKVRSFAINLLTALPTEDINVAIFGLQATVTIDRHAAQLAYNDKSITRVPLWMYKTLALAYNAVANMLGWPVEEVQAVAWYQWRLEKALRNKTRKRAGRADPDARALLEWSAGVQA